MNKPVFTILFITIAFAFIMPWHTYAIEDPLKSPNNPIGIHILFPSELPDAASLINSSGGNWGYVTIPIQSGDRDLVKWQAFMDQARSLHVIPIIRLATEGDYFNTKVWRKPTQEDVLDFANFLNSLSWPTTNRYVVVFNEPNRGDEWGGNADPGDYAQLLSYATSTFKSRNNNFFIISAGLDNAAADSQTSWNEYDFLNSMNITVPGIFTQIDGLGSHAYPNPAFSQPPTISSYESIASFKYEQNLTENLSGKSLPVFITETGWSKDSLTDQTIADYFHTALTSVWNDKSIIAITPFILQAGNHPFESFSLIDPNGSKSLVYKTIHDLPKNQGRPILTLPLAISNTLASSIIPTQTFYNIPTLNTTPNPTAFTTVKILAKWLLKY